MGREDERVSDYADLSRDALEARLKVAEDALTLVGWASDLSRQSVRTDAALEMWMIWTRMSGKDLSPAANEHLVRMEPTLAAARAAKREQTLARIRGAGGSAQETSQ
jgi:hypothetical protein